MAFKSASGLVHRGNVCEHGNTTYEEVYDSEIVTGATFRRCRVCGVCRTVPEDEYGHPVDREPGGSE